MLSKIIFKEIDYRRLRRYSAGQLAMLEWVEVLESIHLVCLYMLFVRCLPTMHAK